MKCAPVLALGRQLIEHADERMERQAGNLDKVAIRRANEVEKRAKFGVVENACRKRRQLLRLRQAA